MKNLIVVDCQYDFIDGSLACIHGYEAVKNIVSYINSNNLSVFYTSDWHGSNHCSFKVNGGIWPVHCVQNSKGAKIHEEFFCKVKNEFCRPSKENVFLKGYKDDKEEYSGFYGINSKKEMLGNSVGKKVYVCGIATEYCVKETVLSLIDSGREVVLLTDCLGYVNEENHKNVLDELKDKGVVMSRSI